MCFFFCSPERIYRKKAQQCDMRARIPNKLKKRISFSFKCKQLTTLVVDSTSFFPRWSDQTLKQNIIPYSKLCLSFIPLVSIYLFLFFEIKVTKLFYIQCNMGYFQLNKIKSHLILIKRTYTTMVSIGKTLKKNNMKNFFFFFGVAENKACSANKKKLLAYR